MAQATIKFPSHLDIETVLLFARDLDYYSAHESLTIDFQEKTFFAPFHMLFIASKLQYFREKNPNLNLSFSNYSQHGYPAHMGFFRMLGVDYGRDVGEAWGGHNYIPITKFEAAALHEEPADRYKEPQDLIQRHSDRISEVMCRDTGQNRNMFDALSYSIREVMRNVFEHSQSTSLYYCAQFWPNSNKVEFAISDFGVGVRRALSENPNFRFPLDKEAIECSLMPSVSGKTHLPRHSENWFNSGYGLYMTSRLARNGGNFVLASGQNAIQLTRATKLNFITSFPGTALRFNLDVSRIGDVQARLSQFKDEGAAVAKQITGSGNRPPSAMSMLLRRDFSAIEG